MAITLAGAKITSFRFDKDAESGRFKPQGAYQLESSTGMVIAKQNFNEYSSSIQLNMSPKSLDIFNQLQTSMQDDLNSTLGLN